MKTDVNMINTEFLIIQILTTTTDYKKPTAVTMFSSVASYALHTPLFGPLLGHLQAFVRTIINISTYKIYEKRRIERRFALVDII
jgi:hypothetical protein